MKYRKKQTGDVSGCRVRKRFLSAFLGAVFSVYPVEYSRAALTGGWPL